MRAMHDASVAITVFSTEQFLASVFLPEKAALLILNSLDSIDFSLDHLDDARGPGMTRNLTVASRYRELCKASESTLLKKDPVVPVISSFAHTSQTAHARNLF